MKILLTTILAVCLFTLTVNAQWTTGTGTITTTNNVGIGTATPGAKLNVVGNEIRLTGTGTSGTSSSCVLTFFDSDGVTRRGYLGDASLGNTDLYMSVEGSGGYNIFTGGAIRIRCTPTGNIGIGTFNPDQALTVAGQVHSTSVVVTSTVPADYVFNNNYYLRPLADVKTFVALNHHLPEVPSAADFKKGGQNLGEMNMLLLKKVEELTLYMIEKDKEIKQLQTQVKALIKRKK